MSNAILAFHVALRRARTAKAFALVAFALAVLFTPKPAHAILNAGAEVGIVKRSADAPANLKLGLGYGLHGELALIPLIKFGPYYMHYQLSSDTDGSNASAAFNTLGLRARLFLPIPGDTKPYVFAGAGYTWVNYSATPVLGVPVALTSSGHFIETPIGVGVASNVLEILQLSIDAAYRPGFSFGGDAFDGVPDAYQPKSGWSLMLGVSLDL